MEATALANTVLFSKALLVCLWFWNKKYVAKKNGEFSRICIWVWGNIEQQIIMEVKGVVWSWSFVLFCGLTQKVVEFCVIGTYSSVFQDQGETDIPVLNDILVQKELLAFLFLSILDSSLTLGVCFLLCVTPFYLKVSFCFFLLPLSSFFFF